MVQVHGDFEGEFEYFACLPGAAVHFGAVGAVAAQDVLVLPVLDMVGDDEVLAGPTHLQAQMHLQRVAVLARASAPNMPLAPQPWASKATAPVPTTSSSSSSSLLALR